MLQYEFCGQPAGGGQYTPVFVGTPARNTGSVNVNGNLLRNYARSMGNVARKEDVYDRLFATMLQEAQRSPGQLQSSADCRAAVPFARDLGLVSSFARVSSSWDSSCGAVGAVFIDVYQAQHRPMHGKNVALIYVESPNGKGMTAGAGFVGGYRAPLVDLAAFLQAVEGMAANLMHAVLEYNALAHKGGGAAEPLPPIEVLQCCLVSGGAFRHPEASKVDVATAIVRGLHSAASSAPAPAAGTEEHPLVVRFAYDEDRAFQAAAEALAAELGAPAA